MEKLFLNTTRSGYSPEQCGDTLTVGELIKILEQYDEEIQVIFRNDDGYTYGEILEEYITTEEEE